MSFVQESILLWLLLSNPINSHKHFINSRTNKNIIKRINIHTTMKLTSIIFITLSSINKHLSHASQMHIHTYTSSVYDSEPYSGIQGQCKCLWTLVDPELYMHHVDISPHYSIYFSFLIFLLKDFITPHTIDNCMTDFPHHHSIMYVYTPLYSPVCSTFSCYL